MSKSNITEIEEQIETLAKDFNSVDKNDFVGIPAILERDKLNEIIENTTEANLASLIDELHITADARIGIKRYLTKDAGIGILGTVKKEQVLIRDASMQSPDQDIQKLDQTPESYMISIAATARGALNAIDEADNLQPVQKAELKNSVLAEMKSRMSSLNTGEKVDNRNNNASLVRDFEHYLVAQITKNKIEISGKAVKNKSAAIKVLSDFRDMANINDPQPHLATVWNGHNDEKITTVAARISPLSDDQKDEFKIISEFGRIYRKPKYSLLDRILFKARPPEPEGSENLPRWYKELQPHQQQLVLVNKDKLIEGKTIATTLRFLPGLRNSYFEVDMRTDEQDTSKLNSNIRTATVAYFKGKSKGARQEVSKQNIEHLQNLCAGKTPDLQIYNYNIFDEKIICTLSEQAAKESKMKYSQVGMQSSINKGKMVDRILENQNKEESTIQIVSCKSGKDRTDFGSRLRKLTQYISLLGLKEDEQSKAMIAENAALAAHGETIAGSYGGNHGSLGLKISGFFQFLSTLDVSKSFGKHQWLATDKIKDLSTNKTASFNKIKPKEAKLKRGNWPAKPLVLTLRPKEKIHSTQLTPTQEKIREAAINIGKGSPLPLPAKQNNRANGQGLGS